MKKFKKAIALFSAVAMSTQLISVMPVQAQESQITAKMHLYDDNGKELYNLNGISDANAKIVIDGEKITGSQLYMAVYGENNKLLEVEKRDLTTLPAEEVFDLTLNGDALQTPKAFLWDGQSPIIDTIAFKLDVITSGEIKGHFTAGNILDFDYEGDGVTDEDIVSYNWERSKSETGTYTTYSTEKSCVTEMDNQTAKCTVYWYKVTATLNNGTSYTTTPVKVDSMPRFNYNASGWKPTGTIKASNPDYTFEVDGQKFVLLDKKATSDKAHYMVIADQTYGKASYRIATGDETYVAEMARIKALLPKVIQDGLVKNVFYEGSAQAGDGKISNNYLIDIMAPSANEMNTYKDKIGLRVSNYADGTGASAKYALRSKWSGGQSIALQWDDATNTVLQTEATNLFPNTSEWTGRYGEIRPVFYLDKDFFTRSALNIKNAGSEVRKEMGDISDLKGIVSGEIKGHFTAGNILDFAYEGINVTDENIVSYNWERATSESGTYTTYSTDASCVTEMDNTISKCTIYWYKVTVTLDNGTSYTTVPVKVDSMPRFNYNASGWKPTGTLEVSNPDYTFEVDGQKFVLLDAKATSDKAHYMVLADQTYGKASYRAAAGDEVYITEMARIKTLLPKVIQSGIVKKVFYESSAQAGDGNIAHSCLSEIMAPSANEMNTYKDKIGLRVANYADTSNTSVRYALRSRWSGGQNIALQWDDETDTLIQSESCNNFPNTSAWTGQYAEIRPIFYLEKDFFEKNALSISNAGSAVQEEMGDMDDLKGITSGSVRGILKAGNTLSFAYEGVNVADENIVSYEWYKAKTASGEYSLFSTDKECVATAEPNSASAEYGDRYYKVKVTLDNGATYETEPVLVSKVYRQNYCASVTNWKPAGSLENSNPDYVFEIDGQRFVLLDTIASSDTGRYMVVADATYGKKSIHSASGTYNTTQSAIKELLPEAIQNSIKTNVYFEGSPDNTGTYVGGWTGEINILSGNELDTYKSKIGMSVANYKDASNTPVMFALRSADVSGYNLAVGWDSETGSVTRINNATNRFPNDFSYDFEEIRPLFYLDKDFFTKNAESFTYLGAKIAEETGIPGLTSAIVTFSPNMKYAGTNIAEHIHNLCLADDSLEYSVTISSNDKDAENFVIEAKCGTKEYEPIKVNVPAGKSFSASYVMEGILQGEQVFTVDVKQNENVIGNKTAQMPVLHLKKDGYLENYTRKITLSGALSPLATKSEIFNLLGYRTEKTWASVEKEKGVYAVDERHLEVMNTYKETGADRLMILDYNNSLYSGYENSNVGPSTKENIDGFANYAKHMAKTYTAYDWFEVWNEPDGYWAWEDKNAVDYTYLAEITKNELVKENKNAKTLIGVELSNGSYVRETFENGLWANMDIAAHHPYMDPKKVDSDYNNKLWGMTSAIVDAGGWKEQMISEVGWSTYTNGGATKEQAAIELVKQIFVADYHGIMSNMMYMGTDCYWETHIATNREHNFGVLFDHTLHLKPSAYSVKTAGDMTAGAIFFGKIPYENDNIEAYAYIADGEITAVMWANATGNESSINITFEGQTLNGYDMNGNPIEGTNSFILSEAPIYLKGFSKEWLLEYVDGIASEYIDNYLARAFGDCKTNNGWKKAVAIMNKAVDVAKTLPKDKYPSESEAIEYLDKNYEVCEELINAYKNGEIDMTLNQLTGLLYANNPIANMWTAILMLSVDSELKAPTAESKLTEVETNINQKCKEQTMSCSEAVLEWAKKYAQNAEGTYNLPGENIMKAGAVKAWDVYSKKVADIAGMIADIEVPGHDNILIQLPSSECSLKRGAENTIYVSAYNYRPESELKGVIKLISPSGKVIDTSDEFTVVSGGSVKAELKISLSYLSNFGGLESGNYMIQLLENNNVTVERKAYLTV